MATIAFTDNSPAINGTPDSTVGSVLVDTYISDIQPTTNYGSTGNLSLRYASSASSYVSLLDFDFVSSIPVDQSITSATLYIRLVDANWSGGTVSVRRMLTSWVVGEATWEEKSTGVAWGTNGAQSDGVDRVATASDTETVADAIDAYVAFDVTSDVAAMYAGSATNHGWLVEIDSGGVLLTLIGTASINGSRPELVVVHEAASGGLSIPIAMRYYDQMRNR